MSLRSRRVCTGFGERGLSVIYDVSHSLFYRLKQPSDLVTAYVGSLRKLLPLPDGGIVFKGHP